jgi:hypothetical protein
MEACSGETVTRSGSIELKRISGGGGGGAESSLADLDSAKPPCKLSCKKIKDGRSKPEVRPERTRAKEGLWIDLCWGPF